jgi:hypothetical protein
MFEDFDPYNDLLALQGEAANQRAMLNKVIASHNAQAHLLQQLSEQLIRITEQQAVCQNALIQIMERIDSETK